MRILVLTPDYPPRVWSGIGRAVAHQSRSLAALGHQVDVGVTDSRGPAADGRREDGKSRELRPPGLRVRSLDRSRFPFDPGRCDLIHLHSLALAELAFEIRRRFGLPLVYTAHSLIDREIDGPAARPWHRTQLRLLRHCDRVLFPSRAERTAAIGEEPGLARRSRVLPNGVPATTPAAPPARGPDGPVVFAGRLAASKGVDLFAAAAEEVLSKDGHHSFVVAGGHSGRGDRSCHDRLSRLGMLYPRRFRLTGWLGGEALERLLERAGLVVMPSRYEPFGMVALEAMRLGTPVLGAAVGGLREVLAPGAGGRSIVSRSPSDWATAIRRLLADTGAWRDLAARGPGWVRCRFDSDALARALAERVYGPLATAASPRAE